MPKSLNPKPKKVPFTNKFAIVSNHRYAGSGADKLKNRLRCYLLKPDKLKSVRLPQNPVIFNWGSSRYPKWLSEGAVLFNDPRNVICAINKLECLRILKDAKVPVVDFYTDKDVAARAAFEKSARIFCRTILAGSNGDGIVIKNYDETLPPAPLYTINFPKTHEYRIHVAFGEIIDIAQKKTMGAEKLNKNDLGTIDKLIRNHANGWFYAKENLLLNDKLMEIAKNAIKALNLDYGAVDIMAIWTQEDIRKLKKAVVCEVNTAPGLSADSTLLAYHKAFENKIKEISSAKNNATS